jgi:iron complex outermembrane receptor protein
MTAVVLLSGAVTIAAETSLNPDNLFEMSLEELMNIKVISGSRTEQTLSQTTVPITVITAEDIHYSGLTKIPEILQFAPGVDVLRLNRNYYAIGVRGLHDLVSDRTLLLINGRSADSPAFGGLELYRMPLLIEDIERIEIVRGPGGAAWGANALTGVINIITKKPEDITGGLFSTTIDEFGDSYSHLRYGAKYGSWNWKFSVGYEDMKDSDAAGAGKTNSSVPSLNSFMGFDSYEARDFSRSFITDVEGVTKINEDARLRVGVGYSHNELGDFEFSGYYPMENNWYETVRSFAKLEQEYDNGNTSHIQWTGNYSNSYTVAKKWNSLENGIEGQYNINQIENHQITIGGNLRQTNLEMIEGDPQQIQFPHKNYTEYFAGLFLIERIQMNERWALEGQIRGDYYSGTQTDWSTRLSSLYTLDIEKEQNLRFSFAKAFRTPFIAVRECSGNQIPMDDLLGFPGFYFANETQAEKLKNEETWALEAGYSEKLNKNTLFQVNTYYQHLDEMIGLQRLPDPLPFGRVFYQYANLQDAEAYGAEVELKTIHDFGTISGWYAYNELQEQVRNQDMRAYFPARHKAGMTCRLNLDRLLTLNINYRYCDTTRTPTYPSFDMTQRLDLTLSRTIANGRGELMVGVLDVLDRICPANKAINSLTSYETPGRTFFARLQIQF